jgi:hypothetical protein
MRTLQERIDELQCEINCIKERIRNGRWTADDIEVGLVAYGTHFGSHAIILAYGFSHGGEQRFSLGGLDHNPLNPYSNFSGGASAQEIADHFNKNGYKYIGMLQTNFDDLTALH